MHNKSARNAMKLINNYQHFFKDYVKTIKEVSKKSGSEFKQFSSAFASFNGEILEWPFLSRFFIRHFICDPRDGAVTMFCYNKANLPNYSKDRQWSKRVHLTVKTISTNIFRHVNNYIIEEHHGSKEKNVLISGF